MDDKSDNDKYNDIFMFQLLIMFLISHLCLKFTTFSNTLYRLTNIINRPCECQSTCPICIEPIALSNNFLVTECSHKYHVNCFIEYIKKNRKRDIECPYCRNILYKGGQDNVEESVEEESDEEEDIQEIEL